MTLNATIAALLTVGSVQAFAKPPVVSAPMNDICVRSLQGAMQSLQDGLYTDDSVTYFMKADEMASIKITSVKTLASSCVGPADCDENNPDAFTWSADVGSATELHGKAVVSYHRGNCTVKRISLTAGK